MVFPEEVLHTGAIYHNHTCKTITNIKWIISFLRNISKQMIKCRCYCADNYNIGNIAITYQKEIT